jgi:hypothetical protein
METRGLWGVAQLTVATIFSVLVSIGVSALVQMWTGTLVLSAQARMAAASDPVLARLDSMQNTLEGQINDIATMSKS